MPDAGDTARAQRKARLEAERTLRRDLAKRYDEAWTRVRERIDALAARIAEARRAGETIRPSWILQERRLHVLANGIEAELATYLDFADRSITGAQSDAALRGQQDAADLLRAQLPPLPGFQPSFPTVPFGEMVGRLSSGAPLGQLLQTIAPQAVEGVKQALLAGIVVGDNPRRIARTMRDAGGLPLARTLTIARTEVLGVYREAARQTYEANADVLTGWMWHSALDKRTCPVCWSMHGTMHRPDESLDSHPSCRCVMLPVTKTWRDLGFVGPQETRVALEPGPQVFARADAATQLAVLGPGKYAAYREGRIALPDLVAKTRSGTWGAGRRERSLKDALAVGSNATVPAVGVSRHFAVNIDGESRRWLSANNVTVEAFEGMVKDTLRAVDAAVGDLPFIAPRPGRVAIRARGDFGTGGVYHVGDRRLDMSSRALVAPREFQMNVLTHEIGHAVDEILSLETVAGTARAMRVTRTLTGGASPQLAGFLRAVKASDGYRAAKALEAGKPYWTTVQEVWARAFAQYVATRSGHAGLRGVLREFKGQWTDEDFAPIAAELDKFFAAAKAGRAAA